jgi:beta-mannosidase
MFGTVAAALRAGGDWSLNGPARRFDSQDWWYRLHFDAPSDIDGSRVFLGFDGLATVAEAWLNGELILRSDNMFHEHEIAVQNLKSERNELLMRFHGLDSLLTERRPRPRWRAPMVENQQLRWFRTTLLGRTPGWSPQAAPVGAWRPVWLETRRDVEADDLRFHAEMREGTGLVHASVNIATLDSAKIDTVELIVSGKGATGSGQLKFNEVKQRYEGVATMPRAELWWPHTHGEPVLYETRLHVTTSRSRDTPIEIDTGHIGFRTLTVDTDDGGFGIHMNGTRIFCRGACWTPLDCVTLHAETAQVDAAVGQVRDAGMNMLRLSGTMVYESDGFLDACDRQGILLWQDYMFASLDYPQNDAAFDASVRREASQLHRRLTGRPCLAILCGNSEVEQQAAMWAAPRERWQHGLFHKVLPEVCAAQMPEAFYWPSSAHGGAFPHQGNAGTTSYYGVGAYRRPLEDARRAEIRFATECLAFANVPDERTLAQMPGGVGIKVHSPQWKAAVPRDLGAGWDFEDVRDHYLSTLLSKNPLDLRYADHERYIELSRIVPGIAMAATFREWRRKPSGCNGGLIWFLRDLIPGAGWGVLDSNGRPKAAWHQLRRVLQPQTIFMTDEGTNGVFLHVINESERPLQASVQLVAYRMDGVRLASADRSLEVTARGALAVSALEFFEGFMDLSYAYRFGPPAHELLVATLSDKTDGRRLAEDFYFPLGEAFALQTDIGLAAQAHDPGNDDMRLTLRTRKCARFVYIDVAGFDAAEQYFHLAPESERVVALRRSTAGAELKGHVRALNSSGAARIEVIK